MPPMESIKEYTTGAEGIRVGTAELVMKNGSYQQVDNFGY